MKENAMSIDVTERILVNYDQQNTESFEKYREMEQLIK